MTDLCHHLCLTAKLSTTVKLNTTEKNKHVDKPANQRHRSGILFSLVRIIYNELIESEFQQMHKIFSL